jgi:hypothetical protein
MLLGLILAIVKENLKMNDENENYDDRDNKQGGFYNLPDYSRLLTFPNFKSKLAKKLQIKRDSLITKKSLEKNKPEGKGNKEYIEYLNAEINLIQYLLNVKDIKDDI